MFFQITAIVAVFLTSLVLTPLLLYFPEVGEFLSRYLTAAYEGARDQLDRAYAAAVNYFGRF